MARMHRIDLPFCLYHVISRTNSGEIAFTGKREMDKFLGYLEKYSKIFNFRIHAWCLMPNHFHLLLESTDQARLSELMRRLLTAYTIFCNRRRGRHGHLFQGRFKSFVVDKSEYLLELSRYIHLNPARMKKQVDPEIYYGSSLRFYLKNQELPWLYTKEILSFFGGKPKKYKEFIQEGSDVVESPEISMRRFVGDMEFSKRFLKRVKKYEYNRKKYKEKEPDLERETQQAWAIVRDVARSFGLEPTQIKNALRARGRLSKARRLCIIRMRDNLPWTYKQIGRFFNIKTVNGVQKCLRAKLQ